MNGEHLSDDLPRLLTGEATRAETLAAAEHLRACPDCQQELVSALVAHATLTSAHRFAPEVVAPAPAEEDLEPTPASLPDLSAVFAQARAEATPRARRPRRRQLLVAAAAAVVLAGGGVIVAETVGSGPSAPVAAQTVTLTGPGAETAHVRVAAGTMYVDARRLPQLDVAHQYEVWLVDSTGQQLRPLGYVGPDRTADLPVPTPVMSRYNAVAISVQKTDQVAFSGVLVAHGSYS